MGKDDDIVEMKPSTNGTPSQANGSSSVSTVSLKLPEFWRQYPDAWFLQVETMFARHQIRHDQSKYEYVIMSLPQEILVSIMDVIKHPPKDNLYENIKSKLIERNTESEAHRLEQLLGSSEMGDRKPSEFFRHLESLAGPSTTFSQELLEKLWMRRLPTNINVAMVATGTMEISSKLALADRIWEAISPSINAVAAALTTSTVANTTHLASTKDAIPGHSVAVLCSTISDLVSRVKGLELEINEMRYQRPNYNHERSRSRGRSQSRPRTFNRSSSRRKYDTCWYHYRFGTRAEKCDESCKFWGEHKKNPNAPSTKNF